MSIIPILQFIHNKFKNKKINVIEIGARYGESSEILLNYLNIDKYIIIDPYESYNDYKNDGFNDILINNNESIMEQIKIKLKKYNRDIIFHIGYSNDIDIINKIDNNSIDLIFIDGNHTYNYVYNDLKNYYPKLKKDGVLCGDDFFMRNNINDVLNSGAGYDEDMVYEAVVQFCKDYNKSYKGFGEHRKYPKIFMITD